MTKAFAFILPMLLFSASGGALQSAPSPTLEEVLGHIKLKDQSIKSLQFHFEQEVTFLNSSLTQKTEGTALFEKPNKLKLQQSKPREQMTIANGQKTWVYTPSYKQVWVGSGKKSFSELLPQGLVPFQNMGEDLEKNYFLSLVEIKGDPRDVVRLAAVSRQAAGVRIELLISTISWLPQETLYQSDSAKVVTRVKSIEVNPSVTGQPFIFVAPPGTDVIPF